MQLSQRASLILVNHHQELLLTHRVRNDRQYWVFPGGSVEAGEEPVEAAKREAREETSIELGSVKKVLELENQGRLETYFLSYVGNLKVKLGSGPEQIRKSDVNQYHLKWVRVEQLHSISLYPEKAKAFCLNHKEWFCDR
ncbi:NUDIX domain-containing protein [Vibrio alginolyticus]|uniref:NUDIX domain-containing protein n=1 Tax=Vibrio alginolyticus TaxID=663 RepID=UPI0006CFE549|nr:NUDIX domain-containing protein [Vibrio alginolyticus]ELB2282007.1 NUDIX domain-containing protein [Vibrio alginolyticus]MCS0000574.1 NUDIX domain-containing protein [Vibrio alginolyticus]